MSPRLQQRHRLKEITTQVNVLVSDQTYFRTTPAYDTHRTPIPKPSFLPYAQPYDKTISPAPLQRLQLIRCSPSNPFFPFLSADSSHILYDSVFSNLTDPDHKNIHIGVFEKIHSVMSFVDFWLIAKIQNLFIHIIDGFKKVGSTVPWVLKNDTNFLAYAS